MSLSVLKYKYKWEIHTLTETTPVSLSMLSKDSFRCCPNFKLSRNLTRKMFAGKSSTSFSTRILHSGHRNSLPPRTISLKHCLQKVCWHGKTLQVWSNCLKQTGHSKSSVTCPESMTAMRGEYTSRSTIGNKCRDWTVLQIFRLQRFITLLWWKELQLLVYRKNAKKRKGQVVLIHYNFVASSSSVLFGTHLAFDSSGGSDKKEKSYDPLH